MATAMPRFLPNNHLSRVSGQSCLSVNDKDNNAMKMGAVHRFLGIYFYENIEKTSARRPSDGSYTTRHYLKWNHLPPHYVSRNAKHIRSGERRKAGKKERQKEWRVIFFETL